MKKYKNNIPKLSFNVLGNWRFGGLTEAAKMWVNVGVGMRSVATNDLAVVNPKPALKAGAAVTGC